MFFKGRWGGKCRKERDRTKKLMIVVVFLLGLINTYQKKSLNICCPVYLLGNCSLLGLFH